VASRSVLRVLGFFSRVVRFYRLERNLSCPCWATIKSRAVCVGKRVG
jgi:hypothetical protein